MIGFFTLLLCDTLDTMADAVLRWTSTKMDNVKGWEEDEY